MNGKSYHLEQPVAHAVPPMQFTNMSKTAAMEIRRFPSPHEAKSLIDKMRPMLADGGFDIRQWASNDPAVIQHLPLYVRSKASEMWLSGNGDPKELTLGVTEFWC